MDRRKARNNAAEGPLEYNGESDYTLKEGEEGVWITVENLSVWVHRADEGVVVDIWDRGREAATEPAASTYAFFDEGEDDD